MKKLLNKIRNSPINYFSDLFIIVMVIAWMISIPVVMAFAIVAEISLGDTSMWSNVVELISIPLTAGGAIWMIKNSVQHAIMNKKGVECKYDFPPVDEEIEFEEEVTLEEESE